MPYNASLYIRGNGWLIVQVFVFDFIAAFVTYGCTIGHGYLGNVYGSMATLASQLIVGVGSLWLLIGSANPLPQVMTLVTCGNKQQVFIVFSDYLLLSLAFAMCVFLVVLTFTMF